MSRVLRTAAVASTAALVATTAWWLGRDARADDPRAAPASLGDHDADASAAADDRGDRAELTAPAGPGEVLLAAGAMFQYHVVTAPPLPRRLGAVALAGVDRVLGRRADSASVLGDAPVGVPPATWPLSLDASAARGPAPLAAARRGEPCACATRLADVDDQRVAAFYALTTFTSATGGRGLVTLDVRVRYQDGLVLWLNGREIARRALAADAPRLGLAERPHGPEWETFHVAVSPGLLRVGANVLAAELRPSGRNAAPLLDVEVVGFTGPRVVRGPMIQRVGRDRATVVFETDRPIRGAVEWGATDALGTRVASAGGQPVRRHEVELTGLPASAAVSYRVVAGGTGPIATFHTAPPAGATVRVAVYGDVRGGHRTHAALLATMLDEAPDLVLATGDLVLRGTDEADWQRFFAVTGELLARVAYYPAIGNHDTGRTGDEQRRFGQVFAPPAGPADRPEWAHWYAFDVADVHIVILDSNAYDAAAQLAWLRGDLAAARARGVRAILAATHDGPYSRGIHLGNALAARDYAPVLADAGVAVLFSGHDHIYQRGRIGGLTYGVSGGGGAPLYPITCGVAGRSRCKVDDGMQAVAREHHYVLVTVRQDDVELCPRRADRTAIEPCVRVTIPGRDPARRRAQTQTPP